VLIFASDLNDQWNDFPRQPAFVPFVHEALRYLSSSRPVRSEYLVGDLPGASGSKAGVVELPAIGNGASSAPEARRSAPVPAAGRSPLPSRRVAVNVERREFDPARLTPADFAARVSRLHATAARKASVDAGEREDNQRLWQIATVLMIAGLVLEGVLGRRLA
jgi:hypothetical protein